MSVEIVLPALTERVTVREIPELFARALHPKIPEGTPRQITGLKKTPLTESTRREWCGEGSQAFPVRLSSEDMAELTRTCWSHLPDLLLPIDEDAWQPYAVGFAGLNITDWQLVTVTQNPALNQRILWHATVDDYTKEIRGAVIRGEIIPRSQLTHLPIPQATGEQLLDAFVTVANLSEYAARHGIVVRADAAPSGASEKAPTPVSVVTPAVQNVTRHKLKKNILDVPIEKAIQQTGSLETADVWLTLKELALDGEAPFTGLVERGALCYTNDKDHPDRLTKNALYKRLVLRRKASA